MNKKLFVVLLAPLFLAIAFAWPSAITAYASTMTGILRQSESPLMNLNEVIWRRNSPAGRFSNIQNTGMQLVSFRPQSMRDTMRGFSKIQIPDVVAMSLSGPGEVDLTKPISLTGNLKDLYLGTPITNKTVSFSINGVFQGQAHTDDQGIFTANLNNDLPAGKFMISADFKGAHLLEPASATVWIEVLPATITIQTVPATPGIQFQMYGQQFVSGLDGLASVQIGAAGQYRLDVLIDQFQDPSQQIKFGRWTDETYQPFRVVDVPYENVIQVGLNVFHKVSMKFVDLDGYPVDPTRISSINIRSIQGDVFTLKPTDTPWLPSSRTARRQAGLEQTDLLYSINSVVIDGSNVVNTAQQRFFAKADDTWTITLLLYSLNISTKDGLFAAPIGKSVNLIFPDGQIKNYPIDQTGNLEVHALARGIYHVSVLGVQGLGTSTPVALSRNQIVKLNILTRMDIIVVGAVGCGFAFGLVVYGRSRLVVNLLRKKRTPHPEWQWSEKHES